MSKKWQIVVDVRKHALFVPSDWLLRGTALEHAVIAFAVQPWRHHLTACACIKAIVFVFIYRYFICSLRLCIQGPSSAVSVHPEAAWIRSAISDGDEDLEGSWRDDQQSARWTRSSFWCETTDYVVCGERHYEHAVWSSIWSLRFSIPTADIRCQQLGRKWNHSSWHISYSAFFPILPQHSRKLLHSWRKHVYVCQQQRCRMHWGLR